MNQPPNTKGKGLEGAKEMKVRATFNEKSPPGAKADPPQKHDLKLNPPNRVSAPSGPAPGGLSNEARIEVKSHQRQKFERAKQQEEAEKKQTKKKTLSRLFRRANERER